MPNSLDPPATIADQDGTLRSSATVPMQASVDATEFRVLEALSRTGLALDATQIAERASVRPQDAADALRRLAEKEIVVSVGARHRRRLSRYAVR